MMIPTRTFMRLSLPAYPSNCRRNAKSSRAPAGERCSRRSRSAFSKMPEQGRAVRLRILLHNSGNGVCGLRQQPVAPALDMLEVPDFRVVTLLALGEFREHRLRIDIAHQFADILPLPNLRAVGGQALQIAQGHKQLVRQIQRLDLLFRQGGELARPAPARRRLRACARSCSGAPPRSRRNLRVSLYGHAHMRPCYHLCRPVGLPGLRIGRGKLLRRSPDGSCRRSRWPCAAHLRLTRGDLESIIERALEEARSRGATQAEAAVSQDSGLSVGVRLGEVETLEHQRDRSMGITVYFGHRKGSASTADFSPEAVPRDGGEGLQHRAFHRRGCLLGSGRCRTHGALAA